jgi:hypothetical protein
MTRLLLRRLAWLLVTLLLGCHGIGPTLPWQHRPRLVILWLDRSASAATLRPRFREWASKLLADSTLAAGDRVVVAPLDGMSYTLTRAVDITLPRLQPMRETTEAHDSAMRVTRVAIRQAVDSLLRLPPAMTTDITQAFAVSARLVAADPRREPYIVLFTDGLEDRPGFRLTAGTASRGEAKRLARQLSSDSEQFPARVCVSIAGVGAVPGPDPARVGAFWDVVVSELGGHVGAIGPAWLGGLAVCPTVGLGA